MDLNIQILAKELQCYLIDSYFSTDKLKLDLKYAEAYIDSTEVQSDIAYITAPESILAPHEGKACTFICIGALPNGLNPGSDNWILLDASLSKAEAIHLLLDIFDRYQRWQTSVMDAIIKDLPIKTIGELSESILKRPFQFYDPNLFCLFSVYNEQYYDQPAGYDIQEEDVYISDEDENTIILTKLYQGVRNAHVPTLFESNYFMIRTLSQGIFVSGEYVGNIVVDELGGTFSDGDYSITYLIGQAIEKYLKYNGTLSIGLPPEFKTILETIIKNEPVEDMRLNRFLNKLGIKQNDLFFCIVVDEGNQTETQEAISLLASRISAAIRCNCYLEYNGQLVFIVKVENEHSQEACLQKLYPLFRETFVKCGTSQLFSDFKKTHDYYIQCVRALLIGREKDPTMWFYRFEKYILEYILQSCTEELLPETILPEKLKALIAIDKSSGSEYVKMLRAYLDNNMSLTAASKALYIHKNTLLYRLERINEILGTDLENPDLRLVYSVALRVIR